MADPFTKFETVDPFTKFERGTDPFTKFERRPEVSTEDDRTLLGKGADLVIPAALRIGGAVVGGIVGAPGNLPGIMAGGAVGSGLGETAAEWYETQRGLRDELNPTQIATQTALGALPFVGKASTVGKTALSRAAQGGLLGGASAAGTAWAEDEAITPGGVALGTVLGATLGAGAGALEGGRAVRLAAEAEALARARAAQEAAAAGALASPEEKLAALRVAQQAPAPEAPRTEPTWRERYVDTYAPLRDFLRSRGLDPDTVDAAANPAKVLDVATGGTPGQIDAWLRDYRTLIAEIEAKGLSQEVSDLWNLNVLESAALSLSRKAAPEARAAALEEAARVVGRQPRQVEMSFEDGVPLREPAEPGLSQPSLFGEDADELDLTASTATADRRTRDPRRPSAAVSPRDTMTVAAQTPRTDRFRMVPKGDLPPGSALAEAADELDELDAVTDGVTRASGDADADADAASDAALRQPRLPGVEVPRSESARLAGARQPRLEGLPTPSEIEALNAKIERTRLGDVESRTVDPRRMRLPETVVDDLAEAFSLDPADVRPVVEAARARGVTSEVEVRAALRQAMADAGRRLAASPLDRGEALPMGLTPADLQALRQTRRAGPVPTEAQGLAERLFELNNRTRQAVIDAELMTPEVIADLEARAATARQSGQAGYAPATRVFEVIADRVAQGHRAAGVELTTQHYLNRIAGSSRTTQDAADASVQQMAIAINEAQRNKALLSIVGLAEDPRFADAIRPLTASGKPLTGARLGPGEDTLVVFRKGIPEKYAVPAAVARGLKAVTGPSAGLIERTLRQFGSVFRTGTTMANLAFALPNVFRDVADYSVLTGRGATGLLTPSVWADWASGLKSVIARDDIFRRFQEAGADFSTFQANNSALDRALNAGLRRGSATPGQLAGKVFTSPLRAAEYLNNLLEKATKVGAFKHFEGQGLSPTEVAWQTRMFGGSPDFARRGTSLHTGNLLVPFLNAQIQGLARLETYVRTHPKDAALVAAAATGHLLALQALNNQWTDPDGTRSWDRITDREKQQNWVLLLPGTFTDPDTGIERRNYLKIPAGHAVNLIRGPIQAALDPETRTPSGLGNAVLAGLPTSPQIDPAHPTRSLVGGAVASLNPALRVPGEQLSNRDFFRDVPIVSRRLEAVAPAEQYTDRTTSLARAAGSVLGVSPLRIEHAVRGTTGGVGDVLLSAADSPGKLAESISRRFVGGPRSVDQTTVRTRDAFYGLTAEAKALQATIRAHMERGQPDRARALLQDPRARRLYAAANALNQVQTIAGRLRRAGQSEARVLAAMDRLVAAVEGTTE